MSSATGIRLLYCKMERPGNLPNNTMDDAGNFIPIINNSD